MYSSSSSRSASPVVTQTIAHTIQGDAVSFEVPVTFDVSGEVFVMLQPILDVFPETAALSRRDNIQLPFLTNSHGVLRDIEDLRAQQNSSRFTPDTDESGLTELAILASALGINDWPSEPSFDFNAQSLAGGGGVPASTRDTTSFFDTPPAAQARPDITILEQTETFSPLSKIGAALISQPMPLSELLISRLFIILPDPKPRQWSENGDTTPRPYRLYFLCDCGPGTTFPRLGGTRTTTQGYTAGSIDIHNCIHIADQTGYEVLNFDQFSEQFGLYTLLVLQLFQQGIDTTTKRGCIEKSKISIPPLSQTHYTDVLQPFTWDIKERVSTAIETLKRTTNWDEFQQIEHPPEIDLRRLWECVEGLQVGGETQVEGMRRMFVHDGTFRWICKDHYESTFEFLQDDRDRLIYMCKQLLEDESDNDPSDQLGAANEGDDAAFLASGQAVEFDDRKKHLRLSGAFTVDKIKDLEKIISNDYTVQQITLASPLSSTELLVAITDMISKSKNVQWNMLFIPEQPIIANASIAVAAAAPATTASITPSPALPPPYSRTGHAPYAGPHGLSPTSRSRPRSLSALTKEQYTNGRLHPICDLFLLGQIQSLQIPDLDRGLFDNLDPSPGDFPYLRKLHIWGSDASGETASVPGKDSVLDKTWNFAGLGALVKSFSNLTELHITGIHLGKNTSNGLDKCQKTSLTSPSRASAEPPQLLEIAQCLLYLPKLSVLNLSSCGLLKENCEVLARSLGFLNNRITHLDIHDNWIEDEGLAELLWAIGKRLYSLDARNTGFGNASAFALASMLQHHQDEIQHNRSSGLEGRMAIYRILRLEETHHPHQRIWPSDGIHPFGSQIPNLDEGGRQNLIRVLELLEPKELCLRFNLGFEDEDFASAFSGMKNLECLERLQVANSNFGPKALAAMLRILRATSCGIRELEIHSTLLSEKEQQDALFQIQEI
ncbi:hypothetical protein BGX21_008312 [Mortierella sp. AD011]|nr:hypothetical protein BGX20_009804 [Mortierella sp. AD010]KAF9397970.1 hypothetical protein BGX21_008312 [Mortierella sp. AD011]